MLSEISSHLNSTHRGKSFKCIYVFILSVEDIRKKILLKTTLRTLTSLNLKENPPSRLLCPDQGASVLCSWTSTLLRLHEIIWVGHSEKKGYHCYAGDKFVLHLSTHI